MKVLNGIGLLPFILENKKQNITSVEGNVFHKYMYINVKLYM